jgi:hypothetical protein
MPCVPLEKPLVIANDATSRDTRQCRQRGKVKNKSGFITALLFTMYGLDAVAKSPAPCRYRTLSLNTTALHVLPRQDQQPNATAAQYFEARAVITVCRENLDNLKSAFGLPIGLGQVIYQGPSEGFFALVDAEARRQRRSEIGVPEDSVLCFTAAVLERVKGHELQLRAIRALISQPIWESLHFAWAGEGLEHRKLAASIAKNGVRDRVTLLVDPT